MLTLGSVPIGSSKRGELVLRPRRMWLKSYESIGGRSALRPDGRSDRRPRDAQMSSTNPTTQSPVNLCRERVRQPSAGRSSIRAYAALPVIHLLPRADSCWRRPSRARRSTAIVGREDDQQIVIHAFALYKLVTLLTMSSAKLTIA